MRLVENMELNVDFGREQEEHCWGWESIPPSALYQWKSDLASAALTMKNEFMIHCSTVKFLFNQ